MATGELLSLVTKMKEDGQEVDVQKVKSLLNTNTDDGQKVDGQKVLAKLYYVKSHYRA